MPESPISSLAQSKSYFWKSSTLELLKAPNHKWYSLSSFSSYKDYLLCASVNSHIFLLSFSLSSFRSYRIETPNWLSTNLCVVHFRRWTVCLELKPSMSVQRGKCDPGTNEPWNENSWKQWKWKRERLIFFLKKSNTPRHWQVSNRSTKSWEGDPSCSKFCCHVAYTAKEDTSFLILQCTNCRCVTSSPNVSKEVASVAASEPPRPRAASVQATLQDIAFKAMLRRLEQFKFSSQIGTYRGPGGPASGERENEWFKMIQVTYVYFMYTFCDLKLDSNTSQYRIWWLSRDKACLGSQATTCIEPTRLTEVFLWTFQLATQKHINTSGLNIS